MHITFLIGNGFDLACGLKTSYASFVKFYVDLPSKNNNIIFFKQIIRQDLDTWADAEIAFGQYTERYNVEEVSAFRECLDDFIEKLRLYLAEQDERFNVQNISDESLDAFLSGLLKFDYFLPEESKERLISLYSKFPFKERMFNILTFNYTNLFGKLFYRVQDGQPPAFLTDLLNSEECTDYLESVVYVHGNIKVRPLVFGVDNENQISNKELLTVPRFTRSIVKPYGNEHLRSKIVKRCKEIIGESSIICIYGMSLGLTDSVWWSSILEWLKQDVTRQLVQYVYDPACVKDSVGSLADALDDSREHLYKKLLMTEEESRALKNQIHIELNCDLFGAENFIKQYIDADEEQIPF